MSRTPLRDTDTLTIRAWGLALVVLLHIDFAYLNARADEALAAGAPRITAHPWIGPLVGNGAAWVGVHLATLLLLVLFLRRGGSVWFGVLACAGSKLLFERFATVSDVEHQNFYQLGATLLGWTAGALFARVAGVTSRDPAGPDRALRWGAFGALCFFAATYVNAGLSKLGSGGAGWLTSPIIRLLIVSHAHADHGPLDALRAYLLASPALCVLLQVLAVAIELAAVLLVAGTGLRFVEGLALVGLHVGIWAASDITFGGPLLMAAAFAIPWGRPVAWWRRRRGLLGDHDELPAVDIRPARAVAGALAVAALFVAERLVSTPRHF